MVWLLKGSAYAPMVPSNYTSMVGDMVGDEKSIAMFISHARRYFSLFNHLALKYPTSLQESPLPKARLRFQTEVVTLSVTCLSPTFFFIIMTLGPNGDKGDRVTENCFFQSETGRR